MSPSHWWLSLLVCLPCVVMGCPCSMKVPWPWHIPRQQSSRPARYSLQPTVILLFFYFYFYRRRNLQHNKHQNELMTSYSIPFFIIKKWLVIQFSFLYNKKMILRYECHVWMYVWILIWIIFTGMKNSLNGTGYLHDVDLSWPPLLSTEGHHS